MGNLAVGMASIGNNILTACDSRLAFVAQSRSDTAKMLHRFCNDRGKKSRDLCGSLRKFASGLSDSTGKLLKDFHTRGKRIAKAQGGFLANDRRSRSTEVARMLKMFDAEAQKRRDVLGGSLKSFSSGLANTVQDLKNKTIVMRRVMKEDISAAHAAWRDAVSLVATRRRGIKPKVSMPKFEAPKEERIEVKTPMEAFKVEKEESRQFFERPFERPRDSEKRPKRR